MSAHVTDTVDDRLVVRCSGCRLVQFATVSGSCRKCQASYEGEPDEIVESVKWHREFTPRTMRETNIPRDKITERELRMLQFSSDGIVENEIAKLMETTRQTVKNRFSAIYEKLGAKNRAQAVAVALRLGLIE